MDLKLFLVLVPVFVNEGKFFSFSIGQKGDYQTSGRPRVKTKRMVKAESGKKEPP
jgi:hypothetical protein